MQRNRFGMDWTGVSGSQFWLRPQIGRRVFFRHLASAVGGYALLPVRPMETIARAAATPAGKARNCIFILLSGAPSHIDTFDFKETRWTPDWMTPANYGDVRFPQGLMPKLAEQLDSVAFLRSVRAWNTAHPLAQTWVQIGRNPISGLAKIAPHIGSVVAMELGSKSATLPPFVSLNTMTGPGEGYFPPEMGPFYVSPNGGGLPNLRHPDGEEALNRRYALAIDIDAEMRSSMSIGAPAAEVAHFVDKARGMMSAPQVDSIFTFDAGARNAYGNSAFGNACLTARNLLRANLGTRFVQITFGGWDHHANIYAPNAGLQGLSQQFDNGLATLMADLKSDGLLDETLIVAMGEFGRTVGALNAQGGRDHLMTQSVLMAGAGIRGPRAIGATDAEGLAIVEPGWSEKREIRTEDMEATIYSALGIDWTTVRHDDPFKRGFEYVPQTDRYRYAPVRELWS
jgi:hypothetical protein